MQKSILTPPPRSAHVFVILEKQDPDPLTDDGYIDIEDQLIQDIRSENQVIKAATMAAIVGIISSYDMQRVSQDFGTRNRLRNDLVDELKKHKSKASSVVPETILRHSDSMAASITESLSSELMGEVVPYVQDDADKLAFLQRNNGLFIGSHLDEKLVKKAKNTILREIGIHGDDPEAIAEGLKSALQKEIDTKDWYYDMFARNALNTARTYVSLNEYQKAGITRYRLRAVLDNRTSAICRNLDGHEFDVASALNLMDQFAAAETVEELNSISPWIHQEGQGDTSRFYILRRSGKKRYIRNLGDLSTLSQLGLIWPPFHGNCRTTVEYVA